MRSRPAILGAAPSFPEMLPLARPTLPDRAAMDDALDRALRSGIITNGPQVRAFEAEVADHLGTADAVAVSSCTSGLMLLLRCLGVSGEVVVPSFTFMASAHAVAWTGAAPRFADSDPATCTLDPRSTAAALAGCSRPGAILATHTYGAPCDTDALDAAARAHGIPLLYDAAHGFGGAYPDGARIGTRGLAEVFSLSPTKTLSTGEGGVITTDDPGLAQELRIAREYGNRGGYQCETIGLNGRMTETAAILGRAALTGFPRWIERRRELAGRYRANLAGIPGIAFQEIPAGAKSSFKDFTILLGDEFGLSRDLLARCLAAENISTRAYFSPPLHRLGAYRDVPATVPLPHTEWLASHVLTLPLYSHMETSLVDGVCAAIAVIAEHAAEIRDRVDTSEGRPAAALGTVTRS